MATKERIHNEWFMPIIKTACPCGQKKVQVFAWGEYARANWRTVDHFCSFCFNERVLPRLVTHAKDCGCIFEFKARSGYSLPAWLQAITPLRMCIPREEKYVEITQKHVGQILIHAWGREWRVSEFIGRILPKDIGKRIYKVGDILQVENDQQRSKRQGKES